MTLPDFAPFPKMARFRRPVVVTEKIDGTNAQIYVAPLEVGAQAPVGAAVTSDGSAFLMAGSRTRWITPADDNFGFAKWVHAHKNELAELGPGSHFGEWWGAGIQRRYGQAEKHFSLFNVGRWNESNIPACCRVVPVLWTGPADLLQIDALLETLARVGSVAAPGFMRPEGLVIFHEAGRVGFKVTLEDDDVPKALAPCRAYEASDANGN